MKSNYKEDIYALQIKKLTGNIRVQLKEIENLLFLSSAESIKYNNYMTKVENIVVDVYGITYDQLFGFGRKQMSVWARNLCCEIRKQNDETLTGIGERYGKAHSTVMYSLESHLNYVKLKDKKYMWPYNQAMARIKLLKQ